MNVLTDKVFTVEVNAKHYDECENFDGWYTEDKYDASGIDVLMINANHHIMREEEVYFDYKWKSPNKNRVPSLYQLRELLLDYLGRAEKARPYAWEA